MWLVPQLRAMKSQKSLGGEPSNAAECQCACSRCIHVVCVSSDYRTAVSVQTDQRDFRDFVGCNCGMSHAVLFASLVSAKSGDV